MSLLDWSAKRGVRTAITAAVSCAAVMAWGCTDTLPPDPIASIIIIPGQDSVEAGLVYDRFIASARDQSGKEMTGVTFRWRSAFPDIATVDSTTGKVTGVKIGQTEILATAQGRSARAPLRVIARVDRLVLNPEDMDLPLGTNRQITAVAFDAAGAAIPGRVITWQSSNPTVAVVGPSGNVTPVSVGEVTITASVSSKSATTRVRVSPEQIAQLVITSPSTGSYNLRLGNTLQLVATAYNGQGQPISGRTLTWRSSNPVAVSVSSNGFVTGLAVGTSTVTVEAEGRSDNIQIQVTQIPVITVGLSPSVLSIQTGTSAQLTLIPKDSAGNALPLQGRQIQWTSTDLTVVTVNNSGVLTALKSGSANVQGIVDGVASPVLPVTVTPPQQPDVVSVTISPNQVPNMKVGTQVQLQATARDINGNPIPGKTATWSSTNTSIATVSANGNVTALAQGQVTIKATVDGVEGVALITVVP